jgi:hypothetical protein
MPLTQDQFMILQELCRGPVRHAIKGLHGAHMEELVKLAYVVETPESDGTVSYEITDAGRAAYVQSEGGTV